MIWWIRGWSLGRNGGLWCREFLEGKELGSAENFECSGAVSGVERLRDGGAAMLGFWVRLGEELGAVYGLEPVLVSAGRKRRKRSEFCRGKGGELQGFWVLDAFSLKTMRRVEGGEDLEVF